MDRRKSRIVELRFFGGLNLEETAQLLGILVPTVEREWRAARLSVTGCRVLKSLWIEPFGAGGRG